MKATKTKPLSTNISPIGSLESIKKHPLFTIKTLVVVLIVLLLASVAAGIFFYKKSQEGAAKNPQKELTDTVKAVSKLMVLPEGETPTLATVSDPEKLKDQSFFAKAQVGDKVLIYTQAKKAILYSPSKNMIVEVSPLNINQ
jgi:cytoskeletal protein RodZ